VDKEEMFDRVSYQKGAMILHYLHGLVGDSAFFKAMNLYLMQNANKNAEAANWRMAVEEATGQDWNWFFNQWYLRGGHPALDIKYYYNDDTKQLHTVVWQKQDSLYKLPLKAEVIYGNIKQEADWSLAKRRDTFIYTYKDGKKPLIVPDNRNWLVGTYTENKLPADWLIQYQNSSDNILGKYRAIDGAQKKLDDTASQAIFTLALDDKEPLVRKYVLEKLKQLTLIKWQNKWKSSIAWLSSNDASNKVRAAAFDVLGEWKIRDSKEEMQKALGDSSYAVAGAALYALNKISNDSAYVLAKQILATSPRADLQAATWTVIARRADKNDISLFEKETPYFYGPKKISFAYSVADYAENVNDTTTFNRALFVQEKLITSESIRPYRSAMVAVSFQVASNLKDKMQNSRTNAEKAIYAHKLALIKPFFERIIKNEEEPEVVTKYNDIMRAIYE
jgi:aminopeptidase N